MERVKTLGWVKTDTERLERAVKAEKGTQTDAEESTGGIVIMPPLMDDTERNAYPEDYIAYCMERNRKLEKLKGADIEAPDFPEEILRQAEEASKIFNAQAGEASRAMEAELRRGERAL